MSPIRPSDPRAVAPWQRAAAGLMFHHFHDTGRDGREGRHAAGQGSIDAVELERLLNFVGRDRILPAREWQRRAIAEALEPGDLCLTFDDNLLCQYEIALPVLRKFGLTAFWFVATAVLQGHLSRVELYRTFRVRCFATPDEFYQEFTAAAMQSEPGGRVRQMLGRFDPAGYLREFPFYTEGDRRFRYLRDEVLGPEAYHRLMDQMIRARGLRLKELAVGLWMEDRHLLELHASGHVIGLHSHTHPTRLSSLRMPEQRREYHANFNYLSSLLGEPPLSVSHPCNSYDQSTLRILREMGVRVGFRSNMASGFDGPLERPREDHINIIHEMRSCA